MTVPASPSAGGAVVDGVDVDAVAAAVAGCPGVSGLDGGRFGEAVTYLPGRTAPGVTVGGGRVRVQVRAAWGTEAPQLAAAITAVLAPLTGIRPVDVIIADIDDPPAAGPGPALPGGTVGAVPGPGPA